MANPPVTDPTAAATTVAADPKNVDILNATAAALDQNQTSFAALNSTVDTGKTILNGFYTQLNAVGVNLNTNQKLTEGQTAAFGALTSSVLGARKAFDNLSGLDTTRVNTFTKQWTEFQSVLDNSPVYQSAKAQVEAITQAMGKAGVEASKMVGKSVEELKRYANAFFESADNASRLQESVVQLAAKTGGLNQVMGAAGPNLSNLNELTQNYETVVQKAMEATHTTRGEMELYFAQLGTIPGALQAVVTSSQDASKNVSMLTAVTQYAIGAHRKQEEVVMDLRTAFRDYNIVGEDALKFTARMGELSNKFGVELSDVRDALTATAGNFKMFGNEAEGAAKMMNQYLGSLESTGISGATAIPIIQKMTDGIKGMSIAQKSFLSAQTGGPGGLMGGFQIEKMLREGHLDQVMDKVKQTLTKQMGPLVSISEAAVDPAAAARLVKQRAMLMQGPLGQFAGDEQSASRIIEGMKNQQSGKSIIADLSKTGLAGAGDKGSAQDIMKQGVMWQEKTHTVMNDILEEIRGAQGSGGIANLTTIQRSGTAVVGAKMNQGEFGGQFRRDLLRGSETAANAGGEAGKDLALGLNTGQLTTRQTGGRSAANLINRAKKVGQEIPGAMMMPIDNIKSMTDQGSTGTIGSPEMQGADTTSDKVLDAISAIPDLPGFEGPGAGVGSAASSVANRQSRTTATGAPQGMPMHPNMAAADTSGKNMGEITVHIEGHCLDCGEKIRSRSQSYAVAPQIK
jgi:hypothetical protein